MPEGSLDGDDVGRVIATRGFVDGVWPSRRKDVCLGLPLGGSSLTWKASSVLECAGGGRTRATAALLITGTVGSGKTTVAETISELLVERGMTHAVVDLDQLRLSWPPPVGDRFNYALELANLRAVAANYWATERFGSFWRA